MYQQGQKRKWDEEPWTPGLSGGGKGQGPKALMVKYAGIENNPSDNLYITGLPSAIDQQTLTYLFQSIGCSVTQSRIMEDRMGTGYNAAMVRVGSQAEAALAIRSLLGQVLEMPGPGVVLAASFEKPDMAVPGNTSSKPLMLKFAGAENTPSDNLYITGFPNGVDDTMLKQMFESIGLSVRQTRVMHDARGTGYSAGMVRLGSQAEAEAALQTFKGQVVDFPALAGQLDQIPVMKGFAKAPEGFGSWGGGAGKGDAAAGLAAPAARVPELPPNTGVLKVSYNGRSQEPSDNLYIQGLPSLVTLDQVNGMFQGQGFRIMRSRIMPDTNGWGTVTAQVQVGSVQEAMTAISLLHGQTIRVDAADPGVSAGGKAKGSGKGPFKKALMVKFAGRDNVPSENLYLTGLPNTVDEHLLHRMFQADGFSVVRAKVIPDAWGSGYSAATVTLTSTEEAKTAIDTYNGQLIGGGAARDEAEGRAPSQATQSPAPHMPEPTLEVRYAGQDGTPSENVYLTGLPSGVDEAMLTQLFAGAGLSVVRLKLCLDERGVGNAGLVRLHSADEAKLAIEAFNGQPIRVTHDG